MKILKDAGSFEILDLPKDPIDTIATAARTCYQSQKYATKTNNIALVKALVERKHHAMLEFCDVTVRFNNVCRGFTHEMVRHRLCDFAQESTRYVDESDLKVVVPPHKDENEEYEIGFVKCEKCGGLGDKGFELEECPECDGEIKRHVFNLSLSNWFKLNESMYRALINDKWKPEDARQVLPIAIKSQIVVKANLREWMHIFTMRTADAAHWEIREVMRKLLIEVRKKIPLIFDDIGVIK